MTTISNSSTANGLSDLAAQLFKRVDADSDGHLSADEFKSFLDSLLNKVGSVKTLGLGSAASAAKALAVGEASPRVYQPMLGFDYVKLNTPAHTTPKYVFARATQELDFAFDRASRSSGLQRLADYAKEHGYPNTTIIGKDKMNFGDGMGDVDVLTSDGQWWWGPMS